MEDRGQRARRARPNSATPTEHLAIFDDLDLLRQKLQSFQPDVIFNLADQFKNNRAFDQNIVSFLEMHGVPFTGCGSTGLTLCKHKGISKKILGYHRIHVPEFTVIARGKRCARPKRLKFPILVKPLKEEASYGISQASFVETDEQFKERVQFIHEKYDNDVIAEEYIAGRELYVSVLGNHRLEVFPIRELVFKEVPPDEPKIATYRPSGTRNIANAGACKTSSPRDSIPPLARDIEQTCKRIYRLLTIDGYARVDLRAHAEQRDLFHRSQPESHSRRRRRLRAIRAQGRPGLSATHRAHHPHGAEDGAGISFHGRLRRNSCGFRQ